MWRYIQTLFRRKAVFLIPVIVVPAVALLLVVLSGPQYEAHAVAWVESSTLLDASRNGRDANFVEAQRLREWLSTNSFRRGLLEETGLMEQAKRGEWPPRSALADFVQGTGLTRVIFLRPALGTVGLLPPETSAEALKMAEESAAGSMSVLAEGANLLHITYRGPDRAAGQRLVEATVSLYRQRTVEQRVQDVQQSIDFYARQLQSQEQRMKEAAVPFQEYLRAHPAPASGAPRPAEEAAELDRLRREFELEQALYENVIRKLESVRIEGEAVASNQAQRFQVVDPPLEARPVSIGLKRLVLTLMTGLVMGAFLGAAGVVLLTWLDFRVRSKEDVSSLVRAPLYFQVPEARGAKRWPHIGRLITADL